MNEDLPSCIIEAVKEGKIKEPFDEEDVKKACPGFAEETYRNVLVHHRIGNPINQPEYFKRLESGKYCLLKCSPESVKKK